MELAGLKQPGFNATLMGCFRGAADFYGLDLSTPMLYGLTGHAFVINIHQQICPSGPYCWNRDPFYAVARNVGLETEPLGFCWLRGGDRPREEIEARLRAALDEGHVCFLINMEYQLITGYDQTGMFTAQPWAPKLDFPQKHLTWTTWAEFGDEVHVDFHILRRREPADRLTAVVASLRYAQDLWANPTRHGDRDYGVGPDAWRNWWQAVEAGHGTGHGQWWNATVWGECREQAAAWLTELGQLYPTTAQVVAPLAQGYRRVAECLKQAANRELPAAEQLALLAEGARLDTDGNAGLSDVLAALPQIAAG